MPVYEFPGAVLSPERARHAQPEPGQIFCTADLGLPVFLLMDHYQIGARIPRHFLKRRDLSIAEPGRGILQCPRCLVLAAHGGTEGIGEHYVAAMRK